MERTGGSRASKLRAFDDGEESVEEEGRRESAVGREDRGGVVWVYSKDWTR